MGKRSRSESPTNDSAKKVVSVFIFRRDLRVADNTALIQLAKHHEEPILPVFFFNPVQFDSTQNRYYGAACVRFMLESLRDLSDQLQGRLVLLHGTDAECLSMLQDRFVIRTIAFNSDYTPFAKSRDDALGQWCKAHGVNVCHTSLCEYSLLPLDEVVSGANKPYAVFTPYYNKCLSSHCQNIRPPATASDEHLVTSRLISSTVKKSLGSLLADALLTSVPPNTAAPVVGGRTNALVRLHEVVPTLRAYATERDALSPQRTSMLSPFMKFGCVSVREVFAVATAAHGINSCFVKELFWREFYSMLMHHHPHLARGQAGGKRKNMPFQERFAEFKWTWDDKHWDAFQKGRTGVPLVDAAVRCLNTTGWCHNRNRMVIGSFATKVLFVDWRLCEQWFATKAVDYDVASNSGGWQWCSGQGADAMPYFRTFNPFQQGKKFDESCEFIKTWVPELKDVSNAIVHAWSDKGSTALAESIGYTMPILDVKAASKKVIAAYASYRT